MPIIPNQKHLFSIPDEITYLNCAYMSPQMKQLTEAGMSSIRGKEAPWTLTPEDFFTTSEHVRKLFSEIVNSTPNDISIVPSVSYGVEIAAKNLNLTVGHNIVLLDGQFPSNVYSWVEKAKKCNAEIITVQYPDNGNWTEAISEKITSKTDIVSIPHNHWTDGSSIDLIEVRKACDRNNSALVIDGTQSLGAKPFDVRTIKPDFLITAGYKWLMGPYSLGYMYVDPKHHAGEPLEYNWLNKEQSENFADLVNYKDNYQAGARRFDMGERSQFATISIAKKALEQILNWGVENIEETLEQLTDYIVKKSEEKEFQVAQKQYRSSHLIGIQLGDEIPQQTIQNLSSNKIFVSARGAKIRIAPHLYNDLNDIDTLFHFLE